MVVDFLQLLISCFFRAAKWGQWVELGSTAKERLSSRSRQGSRAGNVSLSANYEGRLYSSIYFISSFRYKNSSSDYMNRRTSLLCGADLKCTDLFRMYDQGKGASVVCVVLRRPRRLVSSLWGGQYCSYFSKPKGSLSRLLAKTFSRSCVELQDAKASTRGFLLQEDLKFPGIGQSSSGVRGLLFLRGLNVRATLLMQNRWPVGSGPSSNTCPRCASHWNKRPTDGIRVGTHQVASKSAQRHWHFYK